jgi:hypothetical protein
LHKSRQRCDDWVTTRVRQTESPARRRSMRERIARNRQDQYVTVASYARQRRLKLGIVQPLALRYLANPMNMALAVNVLAHQDDRLVWIAYFA